MKSKEGYVYIGMITYASGISRVYVGMTRRPVAERVAEHVKAQKTSRRGSAGKGISFKLLGSIYVADRFKEERRIKKLPRATKIELAKAGQRTKRFK